MRIPSSRSLAAVCVLTVSAMGSALAQGYTRAATYETLQAGTVLKVRLDQRLNSEQSRQGDRFTATARPDEDHSGLPDGTRVEGIVRAVRAAGEEKPGVLDVDFTTLRLPNGKTYPIKGSLTALDSKSVARTASGQLVSKRAKNDRMKFLGYGAGAGAVIGLLTGHNALKGALLGALGGFAYGEATKDKEQRYTNVDLKQGSEFGVRLDQRFAYVPVSQRLDARYGEPVGRRAFDNSNPYVQGNAAAGTRATVAIGVLVNDREVSFGTARPMRSGRTVLVPLVPVMGAAGAQYQYNQSTREITVRNVQQGEVRLVVGSSVIWVNGRRERIEEPARIVQGSLFVPARFVELATDTRAEWDESSQTLLFTSRDRDRSWDDGGAVRDERGT